MQWRDTKFSATGSIRAYYRGEHPELAQELFEAVIKANGSNPWQKKRGASSQFYLNAPSLAQDEHGNFCEVDFNLHPLIPGQFAAFYQYLNAIASTVAATGLSGVFMVKPVMQLDMSN